MKGLYSFVFAAVLALGCEKRPEGVPSQSELPVSETVLVTVDGKDFTLAMLDTEIAINAKIVRLVNPDVKPKELAKAESRLRGIAVERFVDRMALLGEASRRGCVATPEEVSAIEDRFVKSLKRKGKLTFEEVLGALTPEEASSLRESLAGDALCQKIHKVLADETKVTLTAAETDEAYAKYQQYVARAKAREEQIFKEATNVWKLVSSGSDFNEIGSAVKNEHVKFDANWGTFELEYFKEDPDFCKALSNASAGDVLPPMEADGGLLIAKVLEIVKPTFEAGSLHPQYRLAEIFFEVPLPVKPVDKAQLAKDCAADRSQAALRNRISELKGKCKVIRYRKGEK